VNGQSKSCPRTLRGTGFSTTFMVKLPLGRAKF
jgi:hypothetical protein